MLYRLDIHSKFPLAATRLNYAFLNGVLKGEVFLDPALDCILEQFIDYFKGKAVGTAARQSGTVEGRAIDDRLKHLRRDTC